MSCSLVVDFDKSSGRVIRSSIGVDVSAGLSAPSQKLLQLHVQFDEPSPLFLDLLAKILRGLPG